MMENATPMLRQYLEIKKLYPGTILFFRLGDFYEMFNDDALVGSRELEITLTARQKDSANPIPMCGVPHHSAAGYIARLVRKGFRVAICEQTETPTKGTKLVKREVVRVITPGTAIDPQLVEPGEPVYLGAISGEGDVFALALLETSSGDFSVTEHRGPAAWDNVLEAAIGYAPRELLVPPQLEEAAKRSFGYGEKGLFDAADGKRPEGTATVVTKRSETNFELSSSNSLLTEHFGVTQLSGYGLDGYPNAICAAAACLRYAKETQRAAAGHITDITFHQTHEFMVLDAVTVRNLEIFVSRLGDKKNSLFGVVDATVTGMGSRLLKLWLQRPSLKCSEIKTRQAAVTELLDPVLRGELQLFLKDIGDLERLIGRLNLGTATPRDLGALRRSLGKIPSIRGALADARSTLLQVLAENTHELPEVCDLLDRALGDDLPNTWTEGGLIRSGYNAELDELREISSSAKQTIAGFEEQQRQRTGIANLKVRFNNVFGYYIEVSKGQISRIPDDYERRQTLANAERYTTSQLREWEQKVLGADERIVQIETELFMDLRRHVCGETRKMQSSARAAAVLDVLCALGSSAADRDFVCPAIHEGDVLEIRAGRHPVVEATLSGAFIPNDVRMNNSTDRLLVITGANMGGKSTVLRQTALIQILGQIGSFVPAASANLPIVDRIWTRVGSSDDLASGRSTFMVEMIETAAILHSATPRSLVLLDEIGRGTSTFDGLSIAWAVAEYLHNSRDHAAKTLFATHYHEMTELAESLAGAKNYQMTAKETDGEVVFLHKLQAGKASKSYGIAVAKLAGLPPEVIGRARDVLEKLEKYELAIFSEENRTGFAKAAGVHVAAQHSLFAVNNEAAIEDLRSVDPKTLSPDEAKALLERLRSRII